MLLTKSLAPTGVPWITKVRTDFPAEAWLAKEVFLCLLGVFHIVYDNSMLSIKVKDLFTFLSGKNIKSSYCLKDHFVTQGF